MKTKEVEEYFHSHKHNGLALARWANWQCENPERATMIVEMRDRGLTLGAIAKEINRSTTTVALFCKREKLRVLARAEILSRRQSLVSLSQLPLSHNWGWVHSTPESVYAETQAAYSKPAPWAQ